MKIVHFSDWHGNMLQLPEADLYICTGDMYPDEYGYRTQRTRDHQAQWRPNLRQYLGNQAAPVVCIRGNHDLHDLLPIFGDGPIYELTEPTQVLSIGAMRIGGMPGVRYVSRIRGSDRWQDEQLLQAAKRLPPALDILISHSPPAHVLDSDGHTSYGTAGLLSYIHEHRPKLHCFGHIHEAAGVTELGSTICSNAATGYQVLEVK